MTLKLLGRNTFVFVIWTLIYFYCFNWFLVTNWSFHIFYGWHWRYIIQQWWYDGWVIQGTYYWTFVISLFLMIPIWVIGYCVLMTIPYKRIKEKLFWNLIYNKEADAKKRERKIRVPKKRSHKETRPKPISNTFSHSVQKTSDLLKTDNFMIEEDNKAGGKSLYPSERTRDDFGVNAETPFDREEENEDFMSLNLPEEPKEPVVEDLNKIMQETGCQVLADVVVGDIQIDWLAIAKDKIYFIQKDSEDGEWLADEERFNNEDPLWYSESSHRVSPVTLLMQKQEKILALLNKAGIQMTGQCILVKDKGTIINAEDMMATWAELKVIVCRTNLGQPDELPIFGAAFSMENEAASQETINELKQVLGIK